MQNFYRKIVVVICLCIFTERSASINFSLLESTLVHKAKPFTKLIPVESNNPSSISGKSTKHSTAIIRNKNSRRTLFVDNYIYIEEKPSSTVSQGDQNTQQWVNQTDAPRWDNLSDTTITADAGNIFQLFMDNLQQGMIPI
jgi:hypothetical protein